MQDVTDKAEINRATFYKHFVDKYALLDYTIKKLFKKELKSVRWMPAITPLRICRT